MKKLLADMDDFFNPLKRLGKRNYSSLLPMVILVLISILLEIYAYKIAGDPEVVGGYAIFLYVALIIYFAFRDGIKGGLIAVGITLLYYLYIVFSRGYEGERFLSSIRTIFILGWLYVFLATVIGWLKQQIDGLIEREANEKARLQTILKQLPVGVMVADKSGKIVEANQELESILNIKVPLGFDVTRNLLLPAQTNGKQLKNGDSPLAEVLRTGKDIAAREYEIEGNGKGSLYLQVHASAIRNSQGKIVAVASIISDITEQKRLEQRKNDFMNIASHELKTPITSLKLYIDLLSRKMKHSKDPQLAKMLQSIKAQTNKLQSLVGDLLDVSRLETGKLQFHKEIFRLDELVGDLVATLDDTNGSHEIVLLNNEQIEIKADRYRLDQVITNLLTNAIKYSPHGSKIEISVQQKNGNAVVSVKDQGIGIAKKDQRKIFDRLYQAAYDMDVTYTGFGMGLYISREIISRHNGKIWVESKTGKGSTFYFSLPVVK